MNPIKADPGCGAVENGVNWETGRAEDLSDLMLTNGNSSIILSIMTATEQGETSQRVAILARLEKAVGQIQDSESFRRYLDVQARFHHYSWGNVALILAQRPDATQVAGYNAVSSEIEVALPHFAGTPHSLGRLRRARLAFVSSPDGRVNASSASPRRELHPGIGTAPARSTRPSSAGPDEPLETLLLNRRRGRRAGSSSRPEQPGTEQREACPPIHRALEQLQFGDLSLGLPIADVQPQRRLYRCPVPLDTGRKLPELGQTAVLRRGQPRRQACRIPLAHQVAELDGQRPRLGNRRMFRQQPVAVGLLLGREVRAFSEQ